MQDLNVVLDILSNKNESYIYKDLYKILYNTELYEFSFENRFKFLNSDINIFKGKDYIFESDDIELKIIYKLMNESYNFKKDSDKYDKLLMLSISSILKSVFKLDIKLPSEVLWDIKSTGTATKWWIPLDLKIDNQFIISVLEKKISDTRFLNLIRKFLNLKSYADIKDTSTFSGTVIYKHSLYSVLLNIAYNDLEKTILRTCVSHTTGKKHRASNHKYNVCIHQINKNKEHIIKFPENKEQYIKNILEYKKKRSLVSSVDFFDSDYKRFKVFRYFDKVLISVIGSKKDAEILLNEIKNEYIINEDINNASSNETKFLNVDIIYNKFGNRCESGKRQSEGNILLSFPYDVLKEYITEYNLGIFIGKKLKVKPLNITRKTDYEIFNIYSIIIKNIYNYYKITNNVYKLCNFSNIIKTSLAMTLAKKYKTSCSTIYRRYNTNGSFCCVDGNKSIVIKDKDFGYIKKPDINNFIDFKPNKYIYN